MRFDPNIIRFCAQQVVKTKGIDNRRALIKKLSDQYGGQHRVAFEARLKDEIETEWRRRKA